MISQLGHHSGKHIVFGFDHHGLPEVDAYVESLARYGLVLSAAQGEQPHYLTSTQRVCERVRGRAPRCRTAATGTARSPRASPARSR